MTFRVSIAGFSPKCFIKFGHSQFIIFFMHSYFSIFNSIFGTRVRETITINIAHACHNRITLARRYIEWITIFTFIK